MMNINKENYEEYFILYTDQELSAADRKQVELFVALNPTFEEEFLMLQQTILKPDHTISINKNSLFKSQAEFINAGNQEEIFLLYNDNELGAEERKKTEDYINNHSLQDEFALYKQVTLEPDLTIVFDDKKSLYKNRSTAKIPLAWLLTAATFIGVGIWSGIVYFTHDPSKGMIASQIDFPQIRESSRKITNELEAIKQNHLLLQKSGLNDIKEANNKAKTENEKDIANIVKKNKSSANAINNVLNKNNPEDKNRQNLSVNSVTKNETEITSSNDLPKPLHNTILTSQRNISGSTTALNTTISTPVLNIVQPASYNLEDDRKSENYVFYNVTEEQFQKSKLGGFLRKVKRVLERKNPLNNLKNSPEVIAK